MNNLGFSSIQVIPRTNMNKTHSIIYDASGILGIDFLEQLGIIQIDFPKNQFIINHEI